MADSHDSTTYTFAELYQAVQRLEAGYRNLNSPVMYPQFKADLHMAIMVARYFLQDPEIVGLQVLKEIQPLPPKAQRQ